MVFKKSRILTANKLIQLFRECEKSDRRFCFILGSGASVESGIPSGGILEVDWMNCLMGERADRGTPPMDPELTRELVGNLYEEEEITHSFEQLEAAWTEAKASGRSMSSDYYFDLYKLRFHPELQDGYRYMESLMERKEPSPGYRALALLLTDPNRHNLVITTNFDNLVEDSLFLHTELRPLVISHEALADYIKFNTKRPIIVKVHRGLMYDPLNSPETTGTLKQEWRKSLDYAMQTYTPVVIGYGGGDGSLMAYLRETNFPNGIYWCYRDSSGLPSEEILEFLAEKNGHLVRSGGFDALMYTLGGALYGDEVGIKKTRDNLERRCRFRTETYSEKWTALAQQAEAREAAAAVRAAEQKAADKRAEENVQTYWDIFDRAWQAENEGHHEDAVREYTLAIEMNPAHPYAYHNRGYSYTKLAQHERAIQDYNKAIELDYSNSMAYNNRGNCYYALKQYEQSIQNFDKAIELDPDYAVAYNNRANSYSDLSQYERAIQDYNKAIELDSNYAIAYNNRGNCYDDLEQYEQAIQDYDKAIELDPSYANAYNCRAFLKAKLHDFDQAIHDIEKALSLAPDDPYSIHTYGYIYLKQEDYVHAIEYFDKALACDPKLLDAYQDRAIAYRALGKDDLAEADEAKAAELKAK